MLVATHGQVHHLDEIVAVCLLRNFINVNRIDFLSRAEIIPQRLANYDFVIDIGGEYDPERGRFDHHQGNDPRVVDKSAAGLVFDYLVAEGYLSPSEAEYLQPVITTIDLLDNGKIRPDGTDMLKRGKLFLSPSSFIKSITGMEHNPAKSRECVDIFQKIVDDWLRFAKQWGKCEKEIFEQGITVGKSVMLASADNYGPPMLEYLSEKTNFEIIGFQAGKNKFILRVVEEPDLTQRITLKKDFLPNASFVHRNGFMAVYKNMNEAISDIEKIYK